ncbi:MAG: hypothetical protein HUU37_10375 [Bdellovibrionales bacterium]|nr:hypothetical protein [Bdellovibrionales bacterium]
MHPFPHHYSVSAVARPDGTVPLSSPGLPELPSAAPREFDGPGDRWSPETLHWRIFQDPRGSNSLLLARRAGEILGYCVINTEEAARSKIMRMDFARREHFAPYTRHFVRRVLEAKPFAYTWKPVNPSLASGYRGFLMNPVGGRFFSHRVPVITWSAGGTPVGWKNPEHFDIQPLAQD